MEKAHIAEVFNQIATILELKGENPFRCRAYQNAARAIESTQQDLARLVAEKRLTELRGIGEDLAAKITELFATGRLEFYEKLRASVPEGMLALLRIPNLGPKRIKVLHDKLKIDTVEKLEAACQAGKVAALNGFGEKLQEKLLHGIEQMRLYGRRHLYDEAYATAMPVQEALRKHPKVIRVEVAGSLRRRRETIGDLDFLVSSKEKDAPAIMDFFTTLPAVREVTSKGETRAGVVLATPDGRGGIAADLRVVSDAQFPFALNYFTGSKEHNIALRARALKHKNLSLNEYGFSPATEKEKSAKELGSFIPCETEEDFYRALGLDYIEPELREDTGEIEAAEKHKLPKLLTLHDLRGAFHCHSTWSDGHNTIEEMAQAALDLGLEYLGMADHSKSSFQANGLDERRFRQQRREIEQLNIKFAAENFKIFAGVECDILADGRLDFSDDFLAEFDYVVASVHAGFSANEAEMTRRLVRVVQNPRVTMLGHPTGRLLLQREPYAVNLRAILDAAAESGCVIELNANPRRLDMDWRLWKYAAEKGVRCVINPDAHRTSGLQHLAIGVGIARKGWLTKTDVLNTRKRKVIEQWLAKNKTGKRRCCL